MPLATQALAGLKPSCAQPGGISVRKQTFHPFLFLFTLFSLRCFVVPYLQFRPERRRNVHLGHYPSRSVVRKGQLSCEEGPKPFCNL